MLQFQDLIRISLRQVIRQQKRYLGVLLAIALGSGLMIVILTMGDEVKSNLNKDLDLLGGATIIKVFFDDAQLSRLDVPEYFAPDTREVVDKLPGVNGTTMVHMAGAYASFGNRDTDVIVFGVDEDYWRVNGLGTKAGEFFGKEALEKRLRVVVLGEELAMRIFGRLDVLGEWVIINRMMYLVVGLLDAGSIADRGKWGYIPLTTMQDFWPKVNPQRMYVRCDTWDDVQPVAETVLNTVRNRQKAEFLRVEVAAEALKHIKRIVWWVELFVYFSSVATLVLGGFGIWNGMMTAVKARTREIGLKKAMGAEDMDIMLQFITEAVMLSFIAGILGVGLGYGGVELATWMLKSQAPRDLLYLYSFMSIIFTVLLGLGAGFFPALRASRMDVVSAIRYE
ncbi:ABC transporter permease [Megalodesulfovibrio paquesii]